MIPRYSDVVVAVVAFRNLPESESMDSKMKTGAKRIVCERNIVKSKQFCNSIRLQQHTERVVICVHCTSMVMFWFNLKRLSHTHSHSRNTPAMNKVKQEKKACVYIFLSTTFLLNDITIFV